MHFITGNDGEQEVAVERHIGDIVDFVPNLGPARLALIQRNSHACRCTALRVRARQTELRPKYLLPDRLPV